MTPDDLQRIKENYKILGSSPKLNAAILAAAKVAETDLTVLIQGESGSGKESFSKIIHNLSRRKHKSFFAVNCGGIPSGTINAELFGHEKGSFTGAIGDRKGYFEEANGGTLFLDEIGEMPMDTQAMLLRVLEYGEYLRVGSSEVRKTEVRIIGATNVNLEDAVQRGRFREDLYYRLSAYTIKVPPLRDRGDDILLLFRKFARDYAEQNRRLEPIKLSIAASELLRRYTFPGNVRELRNIVSQLSLDTDDNEIEPTLLQTRLRVNVERFLPAMASGNYSQANNGSKDSQDIIWGMLFDMRKELADLKGFVQLLLQGNSGNGSVNEFISTHPNFFGAKDDGLSKQGNMLLASASDQSNSREHLHHKENPISNVRDFNQNGSEILDIEANSVDVTFSLEKQERDLIYKALNKHHHRRKAAADELGISERTLYRKIKQYDLEC
jgi:DNA-binding NtrC family response regulator